MHDTLSEGNINNSVGHTSRHVMISADDKTVSGKKKSCLWCRVLKSVYHAIHARL